MWVRAGGAAAPASAVAPRHAACDAPALSRPGSNNGITGEAKAALRKDLSFIRELQIFEF